VACLQHRLQKKKKKKIGKQKLLEDIVTYLINHLPFNSFAFCYSIVYAQLATL
jgi:hypothetical protein